MALDIGMLLQGLGATALAFSDPRQSLMLSQGIMERNQQLRARKERERQQARQLQLQEDKFAFQQQQALDEQDRIAANQQQLANLIAASTGGIPPSLQTAIMMRAQTDAPAAAKMFSDYRLSEIARERKAAEPHPLIARAEAAAQLLNESPESLRALQALSPSTNVEVNMADQATQAPGKYHPVFGPAGDRKAWAFDPSRPGTLLDKYITRRVDVGGGVMQDMPVLVDAAQGELGADATQRAGLVAAGRQNIASMREILAAQPWDKWRKAQYFGNISGTPGGELRAYHLDSMETLSKLRTGAGSTDEERQAQFSVYGFSPLHDAAGIERRMKHLENSIEVYRRARQRLSLEPTQPLPPELDASIQDTIRNDPAVNPYAVPGYTFIAHHPDGKGAIYEKDGKRFVKPYTSTP